MLKLHCECGIGTNDLPAVVTMRFEHLVSEGDVAQIYNLPIWAPPGVFVEIPTVLDTDIGIS